MGLKDRVKRAERSLTGNGTRIELEDGSTITVTEQDFCDRFCSNIERMRAAYGGTPVPPPHPVAVALLKARYLPTHLENTADEQRRLELQIESMKQQREEEGGGSPTG
jgi:hypothetical protein